MQGCCTTIQKFANEVGTIISSVHSILTEDLAMHRVYVKFVPKLLMMEQTQLRLEVTQEDPQQPELHGHW